MPMTFVHRVRPRRLYFYTHINKLRIGAKHFLFGYINFISHRACIGASAGFIGAHQSPYAGKFIGSVVGDNRVIGNISIFQNKEYHQHQHRQNEHQFHRYLPLTLPTKEFHSLSCWN